MGIIKKAVKGVTGIIGEVTGANSAARGAQNAANTQAQAAQLGIDQVRELLSPFIGAGTQALGQTQSLLGLSGADSQAQAIAALQASPFFKAQLERGENALLQNASATGGLRGGNTQAALAQFAPQLLQQTLQQQLGNLGGLIGGGQNAASNAAGGIADLLQQQGAARAGGQLARGQRAGNIFGGALQLGGLAIGAATGGPAGAQIGSQFGANLGNSGGGGSFLSGGGLGSSGIGGSLF